MTMKNDATTTTATMIGRSVFWIAWMEFHPSPVKLKTCSVMMAPPRRPPRSRPAAVTIGVRAARRPCRRMTVVSLTPLARAVRM